MECGFYCNCSIICAMKPQILNVTLTIGSEVGVIVLWHVYRFHITDPRVESINHESRVELKDTIDWKKYKFITVLAHSISLFLINHTVFRKQRLLNGQFIVSQ